MSNFIRIAEDVGVLTGGPEVLVLIRERGERLTLIGPEWPKLLEAIGTGAEEGNVVSRLADSIPERRGAQMIAHLRSKQVLLDARQRVSPYGVLESDPVPPTVRLTAFGEVELEHIQSLLAKTGFRCNDASELHLVVASDYLRPELAAFNADRLGDGQAWLLTAPGLSEARIGPLFLPGRGPCWRCFESRNRPRHQSLRYLDGPHPALAPASGNSSTLAAAISMIAPILQRLSSSGQHTPHSDHIRTMDFFTGSWRDHRLVRRPQCHDCGDPVAAMPQPIGLLQDHGRVFSEDGGHRQVDPTITFEAVAHHLSPLTGIADRLIEAHLDEHVLCYGVVRDDVMSIRTPLDRVRAAIPSGLGWGKGWTHAQARMSALGEAIERFTLSDERPPDHIRAAFSTLGTEAVDPRAVMLFSDTQYEHAGRGEGHDRIPEERFDPDQVVGWTAAWCVTSGNARLVASDQMWMTPLATRDGRFCIADSNGCAAGNTIEEAILQGLLELIERDSVAIWWYNQLSLPQVDLASFGDDVAGVRQHYREAYGRDLWVLDLTMDLGVPVFAAISALRGGDLPKYIACFGSHLDARIAVQRALTEMGLIMVGWQEHLAGRNAPTGIEHWLRTVGRDRQEQMRPSFAPPHRREDFPRLATGRCSEDVRSLVDRLSAAGVEVIVVNASRPDIGLPVVRVLAPGLRHFRARFATGRLFDVPVALGIRETCAREVELNPLSLPF